MRTTLVSETERICNTCNTVKPLSEYYKCNKGAKGTQSRCRDCHKKYRDSNKRRIKFLRTKLYYGVDEDRYTRMLEEQDKSCAICKDETNLVVDHCHQSGLVRGLLCNKCNLGIGIFKDCTKRLSAAISYLSAA